MLHNHMTDLASAVHEPSPQFFKGGGRGKNPGESLLNSIWRMFRFIFYPFIFYRFMPEAAAEIVLTFFFRICTLRGLQRVD